jgi:hypothetical protein
VYNGLLLYQYKGGNFVYRCQAPPACAEREPEPRQKQALLTQAHHTETGILQPLGGTPITRLLEWPRPAAEKVLMMEPEIVIDRVSKVYKAESSAIRYLRSRKRR